MPPLAEPFWDPVHETALCLPLPCSPPCWKSSSPVCHWLSFSVLFPLFPPLNPKILFISLACYHLLSVLFIVVLCLFSSVHCHLFSRIREEIEVSLFRTVELSFPSLQNPSVSGVGEGSCPIASLAVPVFSLESGLPIFA